MDIDSNKNITSAKFEKKLEDSDIKETLNKETPQMETEKKRRGRPPRVQTLNFTNDSPVKRKRAEETVIREPEQDKKVVESDSQVKKTRMIKDTVKQDNAEPSSRKRVNESSIDENQGNKLSKIESNAEDGPKNSADDQQVGCASNKEMFSDRNNNSDEQNKTAPKEADAEQQVEQQAELMKQNDVEDGNAKNNDQFSSEKEDKTDGDDCIADNGEQRSDDYLRDNEREQNKTSCSPKKDELSMAGIDKKGEEKVLPGCSTWNDEQVYEKIDGQEPTGEKQEIQIKEEYCEDKDENEKYMERQKMSSMKKFIANIVESSNEGVKRKFSEEMAVLRAQLVDARAERRKAQNLEDMVSNLKDENRKLKDELEKEKGQRKNFEREIAKLENNIEKLQNQKRRTSGSELGWMDVGRHEDHGVSLSESDNEANGWGITLKNERHNRIEEPLAANKKHPLPMTKGEVDYEQMERENRLNNIVLKGMDYVGRKTLNKVNLVMEEEIGWRLRIAEITQLGAKTLLLKMESKKDKTELMSNRSRFLKWGLTLENDLTKREKEVQEWIQGIVESEQKRGRESQAKHLRVFLKGKWYLWDERKAKLV